MAGKIGTNWYWIAVSGAISVLLAACPQPPWNGDPGPVRVSLSRDVPAAYFPNDTVTVSVTLSAENGASITAIGLTETIPDGWTFVSGDGPAIVPPPGAAGDLEFVWLTPPTFPYEFHYVLQVPRDAQGPAEIVGQVEYREDAGPLFTTPVTSVLNAANPANMILERSHQASYIPGKTFSVDITIDMDAEAAISALGLAEAVPDNWTFVGAESDADPPAVVPADGATGPLNFVWISVPEFPCSFRYTLMVPEDATGTAAWTGHAAYRQDKGPLATNLLRSTAAPAGAR